MHGCGTWLEQASGPWESMHGCRTWLEQASGPWECHAWLWNLARASIWSIGEPCMVVELG